MPRPGCGITPGTRAARQIGATPKPGLHRNSGAAALAGCPVAIQDVLAQMDPDDERRAALELYVRDLLTSLLRYQSAGWPLVSGCEQRRSAR